MANGNSEKYRKANRVDYLGDFPGARRERDRIVVEIHEGEVDVVNRSNRELGVVTVDELPEPVQTVLYEALASEGNDALMVRSDKPLDVSKETVTVKQEDTVEVEQSETFQVKESRPLDVSGATVDVQEDEPLDVSGATVTVQEDEPLDASGAEIEVDLTSQTLEQLAANISEIGGEAQSAVDVANAIDEIHGALESVGDTTVRVSSPSALDVSAETVSVQEDTALDVSASTVTVQEDTALDVSAETVTVQEENPIQTELSSLPETLKSENYGADIETEFQESLEVGAYSLVAFTIFSDSATDITIEKSWDEDNWFLVDEYKDAEDVDESLNGASGEFYRVTIDGTESEGDTADVVISAKAR